MTTYATQPETLRTAADLAADTAAAHNWRTLLRYLSENAISASGEAGSLNTPETITAALLLNTLPTPEPAGTVQISRTNRPGKTHTLAVITYSDAVAHLGITDRGELTLDLDDSTYLFPLESLVRHLQDEIERTFPAGPGRLM